jgi:3-ketosteroid 9alpha-monooxygenase subunit B
MSQLHPDELEHGTGFHALRVAKVIEETHDAKSFVLEVPPELESAFHCRAGQFLTFRIPWRGFRIARCYSLSSCPETGEPPKVTVKRVDDGRMSNWMNDQLAPGDRIEVRPPAGSFLLRDAPGRPLCMFAGGSGITPVISLIKSALASTRRRIRLIYANRDARSVIFEAELAELGRRHPGRLEVQHHLDERSGLLGARELAARVGELRDADFYVCGPTPYMEAVEAALESLGVDRLRIHFERFVSAVDPDRRAAATAAPATSPSAAQPSSFRLTFEKRTHDVPYLPGKTLLECAKLAGIEPPFSCEEGYCSCCMALLREGKVEMATHEALSARDLAAGFVLTCQSRPLTREIWVDYDI